uniref:Uncharacterized protein n=1 Tax=Cucumis melo TaxID=3656 RepID=A0A9I9E322_CUCME
GAGAARLGTGIYACGSVCNGRETRLGYAETHGAASHAGAAHTRIRLRVRARGCGAAPGSGSTAGGTLDLAVGLQSTIDELISLLPETTVSIVNEVGGPLLGIHYRFKQDDLEVNVVSSD